MVKIGPGRVRAPFRMSHRFRKEVWIGHHRGYNLKEKKIMVRGVTCAPGTKHGIAPYFMYWKFLFFVGITYFRYMLVQYWILLTFFVCNNFFS